MGLLGQLLDGNTEVIRRNRELTVKELESYLEFRLGIMQHIRNRITTEVGTISKYRAQTVDLVPTIPFRYDLDELKSSKAFIYAAQNYIKAVETSSKFMEEIAEGLEEFLVVLEEY